MAFIKVTIVFEGDAFEAEIDPSVDEEELLRALTGPDYLDLGSPSGYQVVLHGMHLKNGAVLEVRRAAATGKLRNFKRSGS